MTGSSSSELRAGAEHEESGKDYLFETLLLFVLFSPRSASQCLHNDLGPLQLQETLDEEVGDNIDKLVQQHHLLVQTQGLVVTGSP